MRGGTFSLTISLDNAAFSDNPVTEATEVAHILSVLSEQLSDALRIDYAHARRLMDINGNTVGEVRVVRPHEDEPEPRYDPDAPSVNEQAERSYRNKYYGS